ncbi:MAG TPA: hypothetical protein DCZ69_02950 [Syntrophobacteraceae bacterium]|nr:hypothetical protein [Syntrophobacteraceae bacterium]HBZ55372.1 hypothetical protein [Syntrophobacteraceae bacterium]
MRRDRSACHLVDARLPVCLTKTEESSRYREPLSDSDWQTVCEQIGAQIHQLDQDQVQWLTEQIRQDILWLDQTMTEYCQLTCPACKDPCCTGTGIFYNLADILYLAAHSDLLPPAGQTRQNASAPCRYLTSHGCLLPRPQRPYICVWFLCEPQMELLSTTPPAYQRRVINTFQHIRTCRLQLETLYERRFQQA